MSLLAVVLSGGKGTRLKPLTDLTPKPMLKIGGKPHLEHIIRLLKTYGVTEVVFSTGYLHRHISDHFGDGSAYGIKLHYREDGNKALGTAGAIKNCEDLILSNDKPHFMVFNGDILTDFFFPSIINDHTEKTLEQDGITIALASVDDPSQYGIVIRDDNGKILNFIEKPDSLKYGNLANAGIYMMSKEVLSSIPQGEFCMLETDIFPKYVEEGKMFGYADLGMYWIDIGTHSRFSKANEDFLNGKLDKIEKDFKKNYESQE